MGILQLTIGHETRTVPLLPQTLVGRLVSSSSWPFGPPLFPYASDTVPLTWLEFRWFLDTGTWACRSIHPGDPIETRRIWEPTPVGFKRVVKHASVEVLNAAPPSDVLIRLHDRSFLQGDDLHTILHRHDDGWRIPGASSALDNHEVVVLGDASWRYYAGISVRTTDDERIDMTSPHTRLIVDLRDTLPLMTMSSNGLSVSIRGALVWCIVPYLHARLSGDGWLSAENAKRAYACERNIDDDTVRTNKLSEDRNELVRRITSRGAMGASSLFERRLAGAETRIRLRIPKERLRLIVDV